MKNLPIGIQTFDKLRENNYLYIDKTKDIYNIIKEKKYYQQYKAKDKEIILLGINFDSAKKQIGEYEILENNF